MNITTLSGNKNLVFGTTKQLLSISRFDKLFLSVKDQFFPDTSTSEKMCIVGKQRSAQ